MAKRPPLIINANDLMEEAEGPHAFIEDTVVVLPMFRFPEHWMIQDWLSNTEYGKAFTLTITKTQQGQTVPGLIPNETKEGFKWALKGESGIKELEEIILDYAKNLKYNM
jgi:hypothetical protein